MAEPQDHAGHPHAHPHHHQHDHAGHDHAGHSHAPARFGRAFAVGVALNGGFVAAQVFYGVAAHSMALLADAVHNAGDVLGLLIAWGASILARRGPTALRSYGWGAGTILASVANAVLLLLGCGAIAVGALQRLGSLAPVGSTTMAWVAATGIVINGGTALLFLRGRHNDINIRGAFQHMAADAVVSAGVVGAGLLIGLTGWRWLDPATSLGIAAVITLTSWKLLRDSVHLAMDGVPGGIALPQVEAMLRGLPGVAEVHDLHVWSLSTTSIALTAHLVQDGSADSATLLRQASRNVAQDFGIGHVTIQIETRDMAEGCALRPAEMV